ncbi:MAG: hypothetical protein II874_01165 [Bacteroidales bacterium]|nr:hypothetical protein [Bacteroidales bacterium]
MKKALLFVGLAAATLSLTDCNKQEIDYRGNEGKIAIRFITPDTKTTNEGLSTVWAKGDALTVFNAPAGTTDYSANIKFSFDDDEAAANGVATGEVELGTGSYDWYAIYPYASQYTTPENTTCYATLGSSASGSQTQTGLDSKAHLAGRNYPLVGKGTFAADKTPALQMHQLTSVIAVNVKNTTSASIKVNTVSVTAPEVLVGGFFVNFAGDTPVLVPEADEYVSKTAKLSVMGENTIAAGASATFYMAVRPFSVSAADMTVKVIADEGSIEKTKSVTANFQAGHIKTLNVDFDDASGPAEIIPATIAEFLAASVSETQWYQLTGTVSNITNTTYGNFDLTDDSGTVYVYGLTATKVAKNDKSFGSLGIQAGDKITIVSLRSEHGGTAQAGGNTPAYFISKEGASTALFDVEKNSFEVSAEATTVTIHVTGNVAWTAEGSEGTTLDKTSGEGEGYIKVTFPANTDSQNTKEYTVFVRTENPDVDNEEIEVDITQAKAFAGVTISWTSYEDWNGVSLNGDGNATVGSDEITLTCGDYLVTIKKNNGNTAPTVNLSAKDARAYAKATINVKNTKNVNMTKLVFNVSTAGLKRLAPITASVGEVAAQAIGDKTVTWTGEATEVTFTVGEKANYGSDGETKAGQLCFDSINVVEGGQGTVKTLSSIAVSGQKTVFNVGDTFVFGGTVTATYSDGSTSDVTSSAEVSTPDLTSAGTQEVTVSYTEGGVTEVFKYNITVNASSEHAGTLDDPYTVVDALAATEALGEGKTSSDYYYIKGKVSTVPSSVSSGRATYFISDDGTSASQMKVYNGYYIGNASFESADQLQAGDDVLVYGKLQYYKPKEGDSELEISSSYIYELKRGGTAQNAFSAKASSTTVPSAASTVRINVYGNVAWTASVTGSATLDKSSGNGQGVINVSIPENTDTANDRTFVVTVAASGFDPVSLTITQDKKDASGAVTVNATAALSAGMTGTAGTQNCTVEGISISISNGLVSSSDNHIRVYKNATITVTAPTGKNLKKVVFNCTANDKNQYGPGNFAEYDGYSYSGKVGTWEGSATSITLTASGAQVRAESIVVTCE